ncbi:hybrid-cluster NAD(P)-dependent oxidoreductase [Agrobacterium tumefaciens]|uniref:NADH oxidoreductase Hcr n=1 Tax=Agrobacterium tumefaciens TaxID=358 RepID=A0A2L2LM02_AGRTU|nr:hybrid-cluster NAD(P)-dependent oxidoreductase [Agrobacterium tumefaciens]AVH45357.1 NADH oxidoreductase Hcr [Agrobacterium tumefaciens]NSY99084.1 hybrid-cluster NAD(P)-dependent oxidoreductase [Agrobacterium tumefaciens]
MTAVPRFFAVQETLVPAGPAHVKTIWKGGTELLRVVNVVDEAPDVKTFTFCAEMPALFSYRAGQFLTLELPTPSGALLRTYTISSTPSRPMTISITAKAQAASLGTRWMFENLKAGTSVKAIGPAGHFTLELAKRAKFLFVSAGSGITPMMSMLRWLGDVYPSADVSFLHCARSPEDVIFCTELGLLARSMPNLRIGVVVEQPGAGNSWTGLVGRLDLAKLSALFPDFHEREVYCCGPQPFMHCVRDLTLSNGVPDENYHEEAFTFPSPPIAVASQVAAVIEDRIAVAEPAREFEAASMPVRFTISDTEQACGQDETLLQAARKAGVRVLSVCEMGLCGTCKVMKRSGNVMMEHNGGITDDEIQEGYVLACCSRPTTAVEIEI